MATHSFGANAQLASMQDMSAPQARLLAPVPHIVTYGAELGAALSNVGREMSVDIAHMSETSILNMRYWYLLALRSADISQITFLRSYDDGIEEYL